MSGEKHLETLEWVALF